MPVRDRRDSLRGRAAGLLIPTPPAAEAPASAAATLDSWDVVLGRELAAAATSGRLSEVPFRLRLMGENTMPWGGKGAGRGGGCLGLQGGSRQVSWRTRGQAAGRGGGF